MIGLLLISWLLVSGESVAQALLRPQVEVVSSALALSNTRPLDELQMRITEYLKTFSLPVSMTLVPTHPIPVQVQLTLRSGDGQRFVGDIEIVMSRPVYGLMKQSPILVVSDREIPFEITSSSSFASYGQRLPNDPLMLRVLYYVTEGLVYYYDSFDIHGGNQILDFVKSERTRFATAWDSTEGRTALNSHVPERWLMEMESTHGTQLRELWYIYHREVLDSERQDVAEENLSLVLSSMAELYREQQIPILFRLLTDSKPSEVSRLIDGASSARRPELRAIFQEVFPTFVPH